MSTTAGITATGFITPSLVTLLTEIVTNERAAISPSLDMSEDQPLGQINGIMASVFSDLWNALAAVYGAVDPNAAEGAQLDNVSALTGTLRPGAKSTVVTATLTFGASTTLSAGAKASVTGHPDQVFVLVNSVYIAASGSVSGTLWSALTPGPTDVQPSTLTVIVTPQAGWTGITNPTEGTTGQNAYSDTALRALRTEEIQQTGSCNSDALRAKLLLVPGILAASVYQNTSDTLVQVTSSGGTATVNRTPHSFEAVIWDGPSPAASNSAIAATIWGNDPSGITTVGGTSATTTDATGLAQTINFTRATGRRLYVVTNITLDPTVPFAGDAAVKQALADNVAQSQTHPGKVLVALQLKCAALDVPGVLDVTSVALDFTPSPVNTANLTPGYDEVVTLATADITVSP
jgi:uncharacterized phage protein gp47/JayE